MEYYRIMTHGDLNDLDLCLLEGYPEGVGVEAARVSLGSSAADVLPEALVFRLKTRNKGRKLSGVLGNLDNTLILNQAGTEAVRSLMEGEEIEYFPITVIDEKDKLISEDYTLINPIGPKECLHQTESVIVRNRKNKVISVKKYVLDKSKTTDLPALFRIAEDPTEQVMREDLIALMKEVNVKNLYGYKLKQA